MTDGPGEQHFHHLLFSLGAPRRAELPRSSQKPIFSPSEFFQLPPDVLAALSWQSGVLGAQAAARHQKVPMKRVNMSEREEEAGGGAYVCLGARPSAVTLPVWSHVGGSMVLSARGGRSSDQTAPLSPVPLPGQPCWMQSLPAAAAAACFSLVFMTHTTPLVAFSTSISIRVGLERRRVHLQVAQRVEAPGLPGGFQVCAEAAERSSTAQRRFGGFAEASCGFSVPDWRLFQPFASPRVFHLKLVLVGVSRHPSLSRLALLGTGEGQTLVSETDVVTL